MKTNFGSLPYFLEFTIIEKQNKNHCTLLGRNPAHGCGLRAWQPTDGACGGPFAPQPTAETARLASIRPAIEAARAGRRGMHRVRGHRARGPCGCVAGGSSPLDGTRQGSWRKHHCSAMKVPGKKIRGGAHPNSGMSVGQWGGAARWRSMAVMLAQRIPTIGLYPCTTGRERGR
jgi:hypothetical protein